MNEPAWASAWLSAEDRSTYERQINGCVPNRFTLSAVRKLELWLTYTYSPGLMPVPLNGRLSPARKRFESARDTCSSTSKTRATRLRETLFRNSMMRPVSTFMLRVRDLSG